jgi:ribosome-associated toxin RatA of RatAB toxin-antitoxin module
MRQLVQVEGTHRDLDPRRTFSILRNFESHVQLSEVVRSVKVESLPDGGRCSHWEVAFRDGILRWTQRDEFDEDRLMASYTLIAGDPAALEGQWSVHPDAAGCRVVFRSEFDLGIGSLSDLLDPLAARILRETVSTQMSEIFGPGFVIEPNA